MTERVAIITTIRHNIGDDFVREGIVHVLSDLGIGGSLELIHKHAPVTAVYGFEWVRKRRTSTVLDAVVRRMRVTDRIGSASTLIQSGAPVYWCHPGGPHCADNEWFGPLVRSRFLRDRRGRRFLNLAGGSCQRFHSDGSEVGSCSRCSPYMREFFDACDLTILRDNIARRMLQAAGRDAAVLPCTSIFARDRFAMLPQPGEYIVLNVMENGGHYRFDQDIDAARWRRDFAELARVAQKFGPVVIACHNQAEHDLARSIVPEVDRFLVPNDHIEFMKFYARAKFGIVNRVHGAFMMASFGKPTTVIGNDTRARMVEMLGLEAVFVRDVDPNRFEETLTSLQARATTYPDEVEVVRSRSRAAYSDAIRESLDARVA